MYESSKISLQPKNVTEENPFNRTLFRFEKSLTDQVFEEGSIKQHGNINSDIMFPNPNSHFIQTSMLVPSARIQMAPYPITETIQEKHIDEDTVDQDIQFMELPSSVTFKTGISKNGSPDIQQQEQPNEAESEVPTIQAEEGAANQAAVQPQVCGGTVPASELQPRERLLADFTREFTVNAVLRNILISSFCDFSINQLTQMMAAGLRIWSHGSLPPVFAGDNIEINTRQGGSASYVPEIRTVFIRSRVNSGYLIHEMAHAWDHIRNLPARSRVRLESVSSRRRLQLIQHPGIFFTATNRRHTLSTGGPSLTFQQMYNNYISRVPRRELAFSRAAREGYSMRSVHEFYAEGYAVFHGSSEYEQAKIYTYAREFYTFLQGEAIAENMPVPNLTNIQAEARRLPAP